MVEVNSKPGIKLVGEKVFIIPEKTKVSKGITPEMEYVGQFRYGDLIASRSNSFLSKGIRFFLKLWKSKVPGFSHITVVVNMWDEMWVAEALAWGVRIWPIKDSNYVTNVHTVIIRDKRGFTDEQIHDLSRKMASLGGTRYQYEGFLQWIGKIVFKANSFHAEGEKAIYCSELGAIAINAAYPGTFKRPNEINPADLLSDDRFEVIDPNGIL